jgi:hypothetical protein
MCRKRREEGEVERGEKEDEDIAIVLFTYMWMKRRGSSNRHQTAKPASPAPSMMFD